MDALKLVFRKENHEPNVGGCLCRGCLDFGFEKRKIKSSWAGELESSSNQQRLGSESSGALGGRASQGIAVQVLHLASNSGKVGLVGAHHVASFEHADQFFDLVIIQRQVFGFQHLQRSDNHPERRRYDTYCEWHGCGGYCGEINASWTVPLHFFLDVVGDTLNHVLWGVVKHNVSAFREWGRLRADRGTDGDW